MDDITVLALADPNEPELSFLERLPQSTTLAVGNRIEAFERTAPDSDVILAWGGTRQLLEQVWRLAPRVRWLHSRSVGLDAILFPELIESPIPITNSRGIFSRSLAEFVMGAVLFFAKDFRRMLRNQAAGIWEPFDVEEIHGQTLGIVGYGDIGRTTAQRARGMGMKILALRRRPELSAQDPAVDEALPPASKLDLMARSDYVVAAAPLTEQTRGLIGAKELYAMKPSAVFMNIGRGPVVDEAALIEVLQKGRIRGAALDVFETEPLAAGHPFYQMENVLLSPHCADNTPDWKEQAMLFFIKNFEHFRKGEPLENLADKKLGY